MGVQTPLYGIPQLRTQDISSSTGCCWSILLRWVREKRDRIINPKHRFNQKNMIDNHINYVELKANDIEEIKQFYHQAFGWSFTDYGPTYVAFSDSGLDGGFEKTDGKIVNGALVILYHQNLDKIKGKIIEAGGKISKDIFSFPGGRRFHFMDPSGNELAVWSDA